ncbi:MAG TPA: hypothetical protein VL996_12945 [Methylocella sp.]|nr:hypothetical protein [Methylocella sp.]
MVDDDSDERSPAGSYFGLRGILTRDWPYIVMLVLALFGVTYTNFARQAMTGYWIILAPLFALICVTVRWREFESNNSRVRLIGTQALHWAAVLFAMYLVFVADVRQMMSEIATSLMVLTVLALGTFTAGIHIASWRVCVVGVALGLGVPVIAWFEERTLLVFLLTVILLAVIVVFFVLERRRGAKGEGRPGGFDLE